MNKRELKISDKTLDSNTKEDKILKSPPRIPDKGVQNILNLKSIQTTDIAYYDIAPTEEKNAISSNTEVIITPYNDVFLKDDEGKQKMGEINNI